ncbi:MAG: EFR1 family ferrodoxin [Lachnospiraceae bacterium]|nr:EFR1 family ferrodoxin [Lachnospiraceae bacterium]
MIQQVHAVYFSPTGNTRRLVSAVAQRIADQLDCPYRPFDFTLPSARTVPLSFRQEDLLVIGLPVYAGRLPNLLLPFLNTLKGSQTPAVLMVSFGNRHYDDALLELGLILEERGFLPAAAAAFAGEHAFSRQLGAGRPDRRDMRQVEEFAQGALQNLQEGRQPGIWALLKEPVRPLKPYYTPRDRQGNPINILKVKPLVNRELCIGCGRCVCLCPMGSIDPEDVSRYLGVCIKCGACIKGCPEEARYYDDPGYLYHKQELEIQYARRAGNVVFL